MENLFETLVEKLRKGIVSFVYRKKDGTERHACGTLYGIGHTIKGNSIHHHSKFTLAYYDVDCKAWRSFLIDNLIEVGELRKGTIAEHHDICLALVVKLKEKMKKLSTIATVISCIVLGSCSPSKSGMVHKAKQNLEASLDYPKQLKLTAHTEPDSAFGVNYFTRKEITGMLKVLDVVTKNLMAKTQGVTDISNADVYTVNLMRRQMNAATEVQSMIFKNTPKGEWSGWKVKLDYECVDKDGMKYRAERWVFFDREGKDVVKTFEIPLP